MTRILVCPCSRGATGRYRLGLPVAVLQQQELGLNIYLSEGLPAKIDLATGRATGLADGFAGWDVVVVQRPVSYWQIECLRDCRKRGIKTVVEIDDDLTALSPQNPAWQHVDPSLSADQNHHWLTTACREADLVTVTTPALAQRYAPHGRVAILPNYIPQSWLSIERPVPDGSPVVGWTGSVATHTGDLEITRGGVAQALQGTQSRFRVIGDRDGVRRSLGLADEPDNVPWCAWQDYPQEIARLEVGIAPLADTAFSRARSWLKPLEYAALGVPCVASPLPSYVALDALGIGILARSRSRDWKREVGRLLADDAYRIEAGYSAREAARALTIERNAWRFAESWTGSRQSAMNTIAVLGAA